jgi:hypothetical protein
MKPILCVLALLAGSAQAAELSPRSDDLILALAKHPIGLVEVHTCHIRGAVWAYGPKPGVNVELIDANGKIYSTQTNASGAYALALPYSQPMVYRERVVDPIRVSPEFREQVNVKPSEVICDIERQNGRVTNIGNSATSIGPIHKESK